MLNDLLISVHWYLILLVLGLVFYPLTSLIFSSFIDKGYSFAKTIGMIILSYLMLTTGILHVLPFSLISLVIILFVVLMIFLLFHKKLRLFDKTLFKKTFLWIVVEELCFVLVFAFWAYVRSFMPDINGLEKFMDYGFVNSILRSTYFPPRDMWFTPYPINYYYFGHFVTAVLTKLSDISSNYTYNLMIATLAGLTFSSCFSIAVNLYNQTVSQKNFLRFVIVGILTAAIVTFAGNLHTLYTFFKPYENEHPVPLWQLAFSPQTFPNNYWYPNATRFIYHTIHEFPIYSWTVSDLHGHVTDIPFVLLTIAFLYSLLLSSDSYQGDKRKQKRAPPSFAKIYYLLKKELPIPLIHLMLISLLVAIMYMTNAWDGLIYLLLAIFLLAYFEWGAIGRGTSSLITKLFALVLELVIPVVILGVGFIIFSLPFSLFFKPFVSGIGILCAPSFLTNMGHLGPFLFEANHCQQSPFWQLIILYGFFYVFVIFLIASLSFLKKLEKSDIFVLLLIGMATFLIIIPEVLYVKDIYPDHYRANTMFKLVFQSFIMLSLVSGYSISRVSLILKEHKQKIAYPVFFVVALFLLTTVFIYPYFSITSYYGNLTDYKGLNGTAYLQTRYPSDAQAIAWLNKNISGQPVILEAQGDSYTDFARVSANTGLPTVLGWTVHEWLWRGTYDVPAPRIDEVKEMYESPDLDLTRSLLSKYHVQYVFVGTLERQKYTVDESKFATLGKIVFQSGATRIYQLES
ncbi:MAG TPA: DUF2298 domain-containing protein [Patescibacteria group bacterium]|nr:DUF2298 domain-containing protein [Patescibacteria group bacterium]